MINYEKKLEIANRYLQSICGMDWDDLPDVNSLHDIDVENIKDAEIEIKELCNDRLSESGMPEFLLEDLSMDEE